VNRHKLPRTDWIDPGAIDRAAAGDLIVLEETASGRIELENVTGSGVVLRFDCDCVDCMHRCQAACCTLSGIGITSPEANEYLARGMVDLLEMEWNKKRGQVWLKRRGGPHYRCCKQDGLTLACTIYDKRPGTCERFHCTRHAERNGWLIRPEPGSDEDGAADNRGAWPLVKVTDDGTKTSG
jgi:Fe-S-cluster containining protein